MLYNEVIDYLYGRLPMFTRDGAAAIKKDLTNTLKFCEALGNPQNKFRSVHIAGTNGKGSSSHMLAAILQRAGYRTGLYTSPHLLDFRERIRIDGSMIPQEEVISFVEEWKPVIEKIGPSFFEVTVAMAFHYFAKQQVDIAIIETGLGGRLDSTNVISPVLSLITNVGMDHMNILGNTLVDIAKEKAGIIKRATPVVVSERQEAVEEVIRQKADLEAAPLIFAGDEYEVVDMGLSMGRRQVRVLELGNRLLVDDYQLDLMGSYQLKNIGGVLASINMLKEKGFAFDDAAVVYGLANVQALTGLMGRWQVLGTDPTVICDTGHNYDGWTEILESLSQCEFDTLHMVIGVMRDKDLSHMLPLLPKSAIYYYCNPHFPRALPAEELKKQAMSYGLNGLAFENIEQAVTQALNQATKDDMVFIGGSTFVVAEALPIFLHR
ncbi:bifunctional folylpolyglutamate synthase/dihydrofolate synthase [Olivibacter sitiensis]|uniref:bifunctional folylpolyglutamate synthase/dihydrofolate synthase n=1 Tax=Olivibacter sitiensis TaxID=376470 RepID=UPI0004273BAC|nr:folylpolyglutamate synthase/dihydrofolate synthase family protein [Olivibacter sitiensis]